MLVKNRVVAPRGAKATELFTAGTFPAVQVSLLVNPERFTPQASLRMGRPNLGGNAPSLKEVIIDSKAAGSPAPNVVVARQRSRLQIQVPRTTFADSLCNPHETVVSIGFAEYLFSDIPESFPSLLCGSSSSSSSSSFMDVDCRLKRLPGEQTRERIKPPGAAVAEETEDDWNMTLNRYFADDDKRNDEGSHHDEGGKSYDDLVWMNIIFSDALEYGVESGTLFAGCNIRDTPIQLAK